MILGIDVGNTNIVVGLLEETKVVLSNRMSTDKSKTSFDFYVQVKIMLDAFNIDLNKIEGAILSSVVPSVTTSFKKALEMLLNKEVLVVGPGLKTGLNIKTDIPGTLGSDLVVDAICGLKEYKAPIIIFDMGTATTVSVIDKSQTYIGGMIIPGIKISADALTSRAAQLTSFNIEKPKKLIGTNTIDCMKSGIVYANASMVDGIIERIEEEIKSKATVIATGGLAGIIVEQCKKEIIYDENLLLKGLYYIYKKNTK